MELCVLHLSFFAWACVFLPWVYVCSKHSRVLIIFKLRLQQKKKKSACEQCVQNVVNNLIFSICCTFVSLYSYCSIINPKKMFLSKSSPLMLSYFDCHLEITLRYKIDTKLNKGKIYKHHKNSSMLCAVPNYE